MDIYHIWCNLKAGVSDTEFTDAAVHYFDYLKGQERLHAYRIMRRKLGLGIESLLEFHIMLEFENLAQLDEAFQHVSTRSNPVEGFHHTVNNKVSDVKFALYRDFPDPQRVHGEERF